MAEDQGKSLYKGTAGDTMVGSWGPNGQKFNGAIDEVMVWERALTETDIEQSMAPGAAAVDASAKSQPLGLALKNQIRFTYSPMESIFHRFIYYIYVQW